MRSFLAFAALMFLLPQDGIPDLRKTALVIKDGAIYEPSALYKALGIKP